MVTRRVVVVGGGCAGLGAAHELVKLNAHSAATGVRFEVHVYERANFLGGKCASQYEAAGAGVYPGEHGFRFFPQFYQHLTQTLREIPYPDPVNPTGTVFDHLRSPRYGGVAYDGHLNAIPRHAAEASIEDILKVLFGDLLTRLTPGDLALYGFQLLRFLASCPERRARWDGISWEEYLGFDRGGYTEEGKQLLRVVPAVLSAMRARDSSARTIGNTSLQVAFAFHPNDPDPRDGILDGPTTEVWIDPWARHLQAAGVVFHMEHRAEDVEISGGRVQGVVFEHAGGREVVHADAVILAVPVEVTLRWLAEGKLAGTSLRRLLDVPISDRWRAERPGDLAAQLRRTWTSDMVGAQYYLAEDLPILNGHLAFPGSEYCLTAVSQPQFWTSRIEDRGVPGVRGLLSVILSEWEVPSRETGKTARDLLAAGDVDGLLRETWRQMQEGFGPDVTLDWGLVRHARLDHHLALGRTPKDDTFNPTPLLIHPVGAYALRPDGSTGVAGLYVASDYNRTAVDLATMEGANEGARQAVRHLAADQGLPPAVFPVLMPLGEGELWAAVQKIDAVLFKYGLDDVFEGAADSLAEAIPRVGGAAIRALGHTVEQFALDFVHGERPWHALDRDEDGDVDRHDLRLLVRGLRLTRAIAALRAAGASLRSIDERLRAG